MFANLCKWSAAGLLLSVHLVLVSSASTDAEKEVFLGRIERIRNTEDLKKLRLEVTNNDINEVTTSYNVPLLDDGLFANDREEALLKSVCEWLLAVELDSDEQKAEMRLSIILYSNWMKHRRDEVLASQHKEFTVEEWRYLMMSFLTYATIGEAVNSYFAYIPKLTGVYSFLILDQMLSMFLLDSDRALSLRLVYTIKFGRYAKSKLKLFYKHKPIDILFILSEELQRECKIPPIKGWEAGPPVNRFWGYLIRWTQVDVHMFLCAYNRVN